MPGPMSQSLSQCLPEYQVGYRMALLWSLLSRPHTLQVISSFLSKRNQVFVFLTNAECDLVQLLTGPSFVGACRTLLVENSLQALLVGELSVANGSAALQQEVSKLKDVMVFSFFWRANLVRERRCFELIRCTAVYLTL